jgi:hypothetical protein
MRAGTVRSNQPFASSDGTSRSSARGEKTTEARDVSSAKALIRRAGRKPTVSASMRRECLARALCREIPLLEDLLELEQVDGR